MYKIFLYFVIISAMYSCTKNNAEEMKVPTADKCDTTNISFSLDVLPIIQKKCTDGGCHILTNSYGRVLTDYAGIKSTAKDNNKLLGAIKHLAGYRFMPDDGDKLGDCDINKIEAWVRDSFPNN